ncbi:MAG: cell surface protein SprA, partial [Flavobacteriales bacterium]
NREVNQQTSNLNQLNEQSLSLNVCNLQDGHSKATYRNIDLDMLSYKKLKMYVHMESQKLENIVEKDDLTLFVRIGSDLDRNYYEYEYPLKPTEWGANEVVDDPEKIWPEKNEMVINFDLLKEVKNERNTKVANGETSYNKPFVKWKGNKKVKVIGTPTISDVKNIMIGVRNPDANNDNPWKPDDGSSKCAEIWVNELRLSNFRENGGWAANARVRSKLADLGDISLAGHISKPGFGSIQDRVSERKREETRRFDISSNIHLDKF